MEEKGERFVGRGRYLSFPKKNKRITRKNK